VTVRSSRRVTAVAAATAFAGVLTMLSTLPPFAHRVRRLAGVLDPIELRVGANVTAFVVGFALLYLAGNLARRKRSAWLLATTLFGAHTAVVMARFAAAGALPRPSVAELVVAAAVLGLLVGSRSWFTAASDPPTLFRAVRFAVLYTTAVVAYGVLTLSLAHNHLEQEPNVLDNVVTVLEGLIGVEGEYTYQPGFFGVAFPMSLVALGSIGVVTTLVLIFRPIVATPRTEADWAAAKRLVHRYGTDTLAYFALRHDKSYFFSSDGEAMIAYAYLGRYALASGDPIGAAPSIDLVIDEFLDMCVRHGWGVAFLAVRQDQVARYERRGLRSLYLGDEAVIDCTKFTLEGKRNKSVRQSVGRVARTYDFELVAESEVGAATVAACNAVSERWRGKAPERGFTMALGQAVEGREREYLLAIARHRADASVGGFLRVVPVYGEPEPGGTVPIVGRTLDLMRRDPDTPNGMTEFLVANTAFALRDRGERVLSMNFAFMGRLFGSDVRFTLRQRVARVLVSALNPFFQVKSLHDFNRRFRPDWVPRVIVYEDQRSLPQVAVLFGAVEGFVRLPLVGRYLVPRRIEPGHAGEAGG
jgi:lysyl-tRNA synthetase class 2